MGSLSEQWDNTPSQGQAPTGSLSQQWDAAPTEAPKTPGSNANTKFAGGNFSDINALGEAASGAARTMAQGALGAIYGGWKGLITLAKGGSLDDATKAVQEGQQAFAYQPKTASEALGKMAMESPQNPINAPSVIGQKAGEITQQVTGSPAAATAVETVIAGAPMIYGGFKALTRPTEAAPAETSRAAARAQWEGAPQAESATTTEPQATQPVNSQAAASPTTAKPVIEGEPAETTILPQDRAQVLQKIGLQNARKSAIQGDALNAATDYQTTKFNEPAGQLAKDQFSAERSALENFSQNIIQKTGGSIGTDEEALLTRGQSIAQPFDSLRDYFKAATKNLYNQADSRAAGAPSTNLDNFGKLMNTESVFAGKAENGSLGKGIQSYMREQGIADKEGNLQPITVQQAEGLKQYINSQWSPGTSGLAGKIKAAIDQDVLSSAGEDIYAHARSMYALKKSTLDDPKGISKMFDIDPNTPVNRATPFEKIPDAITRLPADQFGHIVNVLRNMPEELAPQAQAGIAEIKSQLTNKLYEIGNKTQTQWNAPGVNKFLKDNAVKFKQVFSPQEMDEINTLQKAGDILRVDPSYPGAAAQASNALQRGLMANAIRPISTWVGQFLGGGPGAVAGERVGEMAAKKAGTASGARQFTKRLVPLKDVTKTR